MDPFLRRVYSSVAALLVLLWLAMLAWAFWSMKDQWLSNLQAPAPPQAPVAVRDSGNREDFTRILHVPGLEFSAYQAVQGDTFQSLARKFGLTEETLRSLNQANDTSQPRVGATLLIPSRDGIFHMVRQGQGLADIARAYGLSLKEVLKANRLRGDSDLKPGQILFLPGGRYLSREDVHWIALSSLAVQKGFLKPTTGRFADGFGYRIHPITHKLAFHEGLDLAPGWGARVVATQDGRVIFTGVKFGYGNLIILDHGGGLTSYYAHLSKILVKTGQKVKRGELIGKVGRTGRVTGPHLHFEIRLNGKPQNPLLYLTQ
jgi:murein DD-endopeptidase MepM/ murein hydrolase activator NlpD